MVVVDVDITRVLTIVEVGGIIIMISHKINFEKKSYLRFPKCVVDRIIQL